MAIELTISDLRNLDEADSSLLFAVDGDTETFSLSVNTLFEYTKQRLGYLETGSIEMYVGEVVPPTHTELDGKSFDPLIYPKMGALFPSGKLPDTRGMMLKHAPDGRVVLSFEAEAVKAHSHTAEQSPHAHGRGTMNISGGLDISVPNTKTSSSEGAFYISSASGGSIASLPASSDVKGKFVSFKASEAWTGVTEYVAPIITINKNTGAKNLVDNIAVKFIIKKA